ncbi:MAG: nucleotidyltransferase [Gammaproteobacteria bacterium]|nr:nucleotidyltransferase [Gammaproteobacteria bacterium]
MMNVNGYLTRLANNAIIRDAEKDSITRSINTISSRLNSYFDKEIGSHFIFGSYTRGTILPRSMDQKSDVDYLIQFSDSTFKPQTYLDRLRRFVNANYPSSQIKQSNPTLVLELNHIKFELVPAIETFFDGLKIPASQSSFNDWMSTSPNDINQSLIRVNKNNNNLIKPLIRLMKYWNAKNGYPFASFELEKNVISQFDYVLPGLLGYQSLENKLYTAVEGLEYSFLDPNYKVNAVQRLQNNIRSIKDERAAGLDDLALMKIKRIFPENNSLISSLLSRGL